MCAEGFCCVHVVGWKLSLLLNECVHDVMSIWQGDETLFIRLRIDEAFDIEMSVVSPFSLKNPMFIY